MKHLTLPALLLAMATAASCGHVIELDDSKGDVIADSGTDLDTDADSDSDGDSDTESDCVVDTETCTNGILDVIGYEIETTDDIDALAGYTGIGNADEFYGEFVIANTTLTNLEGLQCLTWIGGCLEVYDNPMLESLAGLCGVSSVGQQLVIHNNDSLTSLYGLNNVAAVCAISDSESGGIQIHHNDTLGDVSALFGLTDFACDHLYVEDNTQLPTCEAENLRDHLLTTGWDGTAHIDGNDDEGTCEE